METLLVTIADRLKLLRQERGWSLDATSKQTGVSKAMLGQIEREESTPTIATLWKIARGFDVSFSSFIDDESADSSPMTHRSGDPQMMHPSDDKIRVKTLFPYEKSLNVEVFVIELLPGCEHLSPPHADTVVEHVIVSEGAMEVLIGDTWHPLKKEEGLRFNANQAHGYRNLSKKKAIIHDIIHY